MKTNSPIPANVMEYLEWREFLTPPIRLLCSTIDRHLLWKRTRLLGGDHDKDMLMWAWPHDGGQDLARFIFEHPQEFAGKNVDDYGTGSGIVAIAAKKVGAKRVRAYDSNRFATYAATINAEENGVDIEIVHGNICDRVELGLASTDTDVITASEVFYSHKDRDRLSRMLAELASEGKTVFANGDEGALDRLETNGEGINFKFAVATRDFTKLVKSTKPFRSNRPRAAHITQRARRFTVVGC